MDLERERVGRWWRGGRPVRSLERAAAFVEDVGFALLFPARGVALPSLYEASSDRHMQHLGTDWGPDAERVWGWKDELPKRGLAWYGRFLRGRPTLLSPALLADLYAGRGRPEDFLGMSLGGEARILAEILLVEGPTSTRKLREATGVESKASKARFDGALTELGRSLLITHSGTEKQLGGWPAAVLDLTPRVFRIPTRRPTLAVRRARAAARFQGTMVEATATELAWAFGWTTEQARAAFASSPEGERPWDPRA